MPRHFRIHPAIGIARMGNSPNHFIGTETPGVPCNWNDDKQAFNTFRDGEKVLRQGARFHVFEYDEDATGALSNPREVTVGGDVLDIEWQVHLANRKASFFQFSGQAGAGDLYVERSNSLSSAKLDDDHLNGRNPDSLKVLDPARTARLDIDPGEQLISQRRQAGPIELSNPNAKIPIQSLGTLLLDDTGRIIVLGGYGESNSTDLKNNPIQDYANNDTWFDDASDGSVKARIRFKDDSFADADAAWVMVGPPDFAPSIGNVVSLYDTLWDTGVRDVNFPAAPATPALAALLDQKNKWQATGGKSLSGFKPSFKDDIYPLLKRALGARDVHISGKSEDATKHPNYHNISMSDWALLSALEGDSAPEGARMRQYIFSRIRIPDSTELEWEQMPRGLGDDYTSLDKNSPTPKSFLSLTRIQYAMLQEWAKGNFDPDWPGHEPQFKTNPTPTPDDLDRAAAENCVGGPFYPGIEVSWLIRSKALFSEPFRMKISREPENEKAPVKVPIGALEFRPGFFSQQMAVPWQADFYDCHKERQEDFTGNEYYFMWWTAQRPDDVFPSGSKNQVRWVRKFDDPSKSLKENEDDPVRFKRMQTRWPELKFVVVKNDDHLEEEP